MYEAWSSIQWKCAYLGKSRRFSCRGLHLAREQFAAALRYFEAKKRKADTRGRFVGADAADATLLHWDWMLKLKLSGCGRMTPYNLTTPGFARLVGCGRMTPCKLWILLRASYTSQLNATCVANERKVLTRDD